MEKLSSRLEVRMDASKNAPSALAAFNTVVHKLSSAALKSLTFIFLPISVADAGAFASAKTRIGSCDFLDLNNKVFVAKALLSCVKFNFLNESASVICRRLSMHYAKREVRR